MATEAQQKFIQLFTDAMARADAYPQLAEYIASLKAEALQDCLTSYFEVSQRYGASDKGNLRAFYDLTLAALTKSDPWFALKVEVVTQSRGTLWYTRFNALEAKQKARLNAQVKAKRQALAAATKRFLEKFEAYMKQPKTQIKPFSEYIYALRADQQQECLLAYLEVSVRFADDSADSLRIFWALSSLTIARSDAYYAAKYETRIKAAGTLWNTRFNALQPEQREEIAKQIREKKKGLKVDITPPGADSKERGKITQTSTQLKFLAVFDECMKKKDPRPVADFAMPLPFQQRRECLTAYLQASTRYPDDNPVSLNIFFGLSSLVINRGDAYYAFKYEYLIATAGTLWAKRFDALDDRQKKVLRDEIEKRHRDSRIIDEVKLEYFRKNQKDPDLKALQAFEPATNADQKKLLRDALDACRHNFVLHKVEEFLKSFDALGDLFKAQKDSAVFVSMLKWIRETPMRPRMLHEELYGYAVQAFCLHAMSGPRGPTYLKGFNDEETAWLLSGEAPKGFYFDDFQERLNYAVYKCHGRADITNVAKAHAAMLLFADLYGVRLAPMMEAAGVRALVETLRTKEPRSIDDLRIPVNAPLFRNAKLRIGQTVGNIFIVWWDSSSSTAYIEINGLEKVLFSVDSYFRLGQMYQDDMTYGEIWRGTQHLLKVIPVFFEIIGYLPDLLSGGFTGLVKAVIINYAAEGISNQVFDGSTGANIALNLVGSALTGHGPKGDDIADDIATAVGKEGTQLARLTDNSLAKVATQGEQQAAKLGGVPVNLSNRTAAATDGTAARLGPDAPKPPDTPDAPTTQGAKPPDPPPLNENIAAQLRGVTPPSRMLPEGRISGSAEVTSIATGIDAVEAHAISQVVNVEFTKMRGFTTAWNRVASAHRARMNQVRDMFATNMTKREIAHEARETFNTLRTEFWTYVGTSQDLAAREIRDQLSHAGFSIAQDGTAPFIRVRGANGPVEFRLDVDHMDELGDQPAKAFSARNYRLTPSRENRVVLNQYHIQDPHTPDLRMTSGTGTGRGGKLRGDPNYKGRSPHSALLPDPNNRALSESMAADAQEAIDEALRRLNSSGSDDVF